MNMRLTISALPASLPLLPLLALAALSGCAAGKEEEDPLAHACEVIADAGTAITAGADIDSAPGIQIGDTPYTVTLVPGAASYVSVNVSGDTAAILFMGTADIAQTLYQDGADVGLSEGAPDDLCPEDVPEHYDVDLHTAGTWTFELGPAAVSEVWLLLHDAGAHVDEQ